MRGIGHVAFTEGDAGRMPYADGSFDLVVSNLGLNNFPDVDAAMTEILVYAGGIMVLPAVLILLAFAIFPLIISVYLSLCRFALAGGSFTLTFVGFFNFRRLLFGAVMIWSAILAAVRWRERISRLLSVVV